MQQKRSCFYLNITEKEVGEDSNAPSMKSISTTIGNIEYKVFASTKTGAPILDLTTDYQKNYVPQFHISYTSIDEIIQKFNM